MEQDTDTHKYSQPQFDQGTKAIQWENSSFFH